jgi:NRAMP (natural resistance-associated macrophage protein)-like metal ion transporter
MPDLPVTGRSPQAPRKAAQKPPPKGLWRVLGPGLITGASDDDPSGIATYSQVGSQFGYGLAWTMLFSYPLMAAMQEISARIGRVTGHGIAGAIRRHYSPTLLRVIVLLLIVANTINLGADLGAMADALRLLIGGPGKLYVVGFAVLCAALEIFLSYQRYVAILKWSTITLLAYVATVVVVDVPWRDLIANVLMPDISLKQDYIVAVVAVLGTTISPYLFFWQASEEAEDERVNPSARPLLAAHRQAPRELSRIRLDTYVGMGYSNLIGLFIIITAAATLNAHGVSDINSSAQAAEALRPIAGPFAFAVFAAGIIGTGLLAVPVLAGSAAYAVGEALGWKVGLGRLPRQAKSFYGTIAVATLVGIGINFVAIDPIKALFWSAVLNGVIAVPLMIVMMIMTANPKVMGPFTLSRPLWLMGWLATLVMAATVLAMLWSMMS